PRTWMHALQMLSRGTPFRLRAREWLASEWPLAVILGRPRRAFNAPLASAGAADLPPPAAMRRHPGSGPQTPHQEHVPQRPVAEGRAAHPPLHLKAETPVKADRRLIVLE